MRTKGQGLLVLLFIVALILGSTSGVFADRVVLLKIDGKNITSDVGPVVENGSTLISLKVIKDRFGAIVQYDATKKIATIDTAAHTLVFTADSKNYTLDGTAKTLTVAPKVVKGKILVPAKAFADAIGAKVAFDNTNYLLTMNYFTTLTGTLKVTGSTTVQPIAQAAADLLMKTNKNLSITVAGGGSGAGVKDTIAGTTNIGMSSRELTTDEKKQIMAIPMADDAIAIIVHPSNPVKSLTKDQAAKIFLGEIKNWNQVGGPNAPILVQTRETGSGTRATLEEMILSKKSVVATATPHTSSAIILQAVAKDKYAIGYDSVGFVNSTVKAISLNDVEPTLTNIKSGKYAMGRSLFMLSKGRPSGISAMFIDYVRTYDAQSNIVVKEGYLRFQ